jgi:hypothetical protein
MPKKNAKPRVDARSTENPAELDRANDNIRSVSMGSEPSEEDIRARAYQKFLERGGAHGSHLDDWVSAERELRDK